MQRGMRRENGYGRLRRRETVDVGSVGRMEHAVSAIPSGIGQFKVLAEAWIHDKVHDREQRAKLLCIDLIGNARFDAELRNCLDPLPALFGVRLTISRFMPFSCQFIEPVHKKIEERKHPRRMPRHRD